MALAERWVSRPRSTPAHGEGEGGGRVSEWKWSCLESHFCEERPTGVNSAAVGAEAPAVRAVSGRGCPAPRAGVMVLVRLV